MFSPWLPRPIRDPQDTELCRRSLQFRLTEDFSSPRDFKSLKTRLPDLLFQLCFQQGAGNSACPQVDVVLSPFRDRFAHQDIGDLQPPSWLQHPKQLGKHPLFVRGKINRTISRSPTSAHSSGTGSSSLYPWMNLRLSIPASLEHYAFLAFSIISGVISTPITFPCAPTRCAAIRLFNPAPIPTSTTFSPAFIFPRLKTLPVPAKIR